MSKLKNTALFLFGVLLLWLTLKNLPLTELGHKLQNVNYWLIVPVFAVTLFGYWVRIQRWFLLYDQLDEKPSKRGAWVGLSAGYLVSYVFPRAGEITRCLIMKRYSQVAINKSLATIIAERLTDICVLLFLVTCISLFNVQNMSSFFVANIITPIYEKFGWKVLVVLAVLGLVGLMCIGLYLKKKNKANNWFDEFLMALTKITQLKHKPLYVLYTLLTWVCYFLMTYIWVFAFEESQSLSIIQVFVIMIVGTIGKSVPIQGGGMGAYHFLAAQAFLFFGVSLITGNALAIIIHGAQTAYTIITGFTAYGILLFDEKKRNL